MVKKNKKSPTFIKNNLSQEKKYKDISKVLRKRGENHPDNLEFYIQGENLQK